MIYSDDAIIARDGDSWSYFKLIVDPSSEESEQAIKYSGFSGVQSLWTVTSPESGYAVVAYSSIVSRGDFKMVLVDPDGYVQTIFEGNADAEKTIPLFPGTNRIKIVGRQANGSVTVKIAADSGTEIRKIF